jgi:hypothetical protein
MNLRTTGIILIIIGIITFSYEGIVRYKTRDNVLDAGPVHVTAERTHTVNIPPIAGAVALIGGVALLVGSAKHA